jgi:four helix bundle protein
MIEKQKPTTIQQRTFSFPVEIVRWCQQLEKKSSINRALLQQLLRSGTSIGANVEESQAGQSRADFVSKYAIALKEAKEPLCWLRLLQETSSPSKDEYAPSIQEAEEISKIIGSIIVNTKKNST